MIMASRSKLCLAYKYEGKFEEFDVTKLPGVFVYIKLGNTLELLQLSYHRLATETI